MCLMMTVRWQDRTMGGKGRWCSTTTVMWQKRGVVAVNALDDDSEVAGWKDGQKRKVVT